MEDTIETKARLKQIMSEQNLRQIDILNASQPYQKQLGIKMSKSHLSQYVNGKSVPDQRKLFLLAKTLNVNEAWLMGYDVKKERASDIKEEEGAESSTLSLINDTSAKLEPFRQHKVYAFAEAQLKEQEKENSRNKNITSLEQYKERKQHKKDMSLIDWRGAVSAGTGEFLENEYREELTLPTEIIPEGADFCLSVNGNSMEPIFHHDDYVFVKEQLEIYSGAIGVVIVNGQAFLKRIWFENDHARLQSFNSDYDDIIVTEEDDFRVIGKVVM